MNLETSSQYKNGEVKKYLTHGADLAPQYQEMITGAGEMVKCLRALVALTEGKSCFLAYKLDKSQRLLF